MNKKVLTNLMVADSMLRGSGFIYAPTLGKRATQKTYKHKNANIEYYTDEKGNIRRRRK